MPIERPESTDSEPRRKWSPYRKEALVVDLPVVVDEWDPVMKDQYLISVEETPLADTLVLEARRSALEGVRVAVDIRRRPGDSGSACE